MNKIQLCIIIIVAVAFMGGVHVQKSFGCDGILSDYIQVQREYKDLKQFEEEADTRAVAVQMRREQNNLVPKIRRLRGEFVQCIERRKRQVRSNEGSDAMQDYLSRQESIARQMAADMGLTGIIPDIW